MAINIRQRIRTLRKEKGYTAQQIAERMGISRPFYTQLEGGKRRLSIEYLEGIARALGVTPYQLYAEDPPHAAGPSEGTRQNPHLQPVRRDQLRKKLQPILKDSVEDFLDCYQWWVKTPETDKRQFREDIKQ